jgi:rubrerythrin
MLSVLFEQIVYKTNPHCQYPYDNAGDNSTKDGIDIIDKKHKELNKKFKENIISRCFKCNNSVIKNGNFCPICNEDSW